jgi:hypothetical protein
MHASELKVVEINMVQAWGVALDHVVELHSKAVEAVSIFQYGVDSYFDLIAVHLLGPLAQGVSAHVVAGARGGSQNKPTHESLDTMRLSARRGSAFRKN